MVRAILSIFTFIGLVMAFVLGGFGVAPALEKREPQWSDMGASADLVPNEPQERRFFEVVMRGWIVAAPSVTGPSIKAGRDVFAKSGCYSCHKIHGKGGGIGQDLTHIGRRRDAEWLKRFLENPQAVIPGTIMPKPEITERELDDLVNYLVTLR